MVTATNGTTEASRVAGRAMGANQDAWEVGLEAATGIQRLWLDQWTAWAELGLAWLAPATARQVDERLEVAERGAAKREAELRTRLERVTTDLHESQQEAARQ